MPWNNSKRAIIDRRRRQIAELRLRGHTQREIAALVGCGLATVNRDIKHLRRRWQQAAQESVAEHQARTWMEICEVKREAWSGEPPKLRTILSAISAERQLLGLDTQGILTPSQLQRLVNDLGTLLNRHLPHDYQREKFADELKALIDAI